jgi:hypothetical protein
MTPAENEHGLTTADLRGSAYRALLSGAAGHVFGNNPIWHFDSPGLYPAPVGRQEALGGTVRLRLEALAGPRAAAAWYDPTSGRLASAAEQPFPAEGSRIFENVHLNSAAAHDWVLVLQSRS